MAKWVWLLGIVVLAAGCRADAASAPAEVVQAQVTVIPTIVSEELLPERIERARSFIKVAQSETGLGANDKWASVDECIEEMMAVVFESPDRVVVRAVKPGFISISFRVEQLCQQDMVIQEQSERVQRVLLWWALNGKTGVER